MNQNQIIGLNIRRFRDALGMSQDNLGEYLNKSRVQVAYYENGSRDIPSEIISKIAKLFGIEEYDLYEEDPSMNAANVAFAFRAEQLDPSDLEEIASFRRIVLNYLNMKKALSNE